MGTDLMSNYPVTAYRTKSILDRGFQPVRNVTRTLRLPNAVNDNFISAAANDNLVLKAEARYLPRLVSRSILRKLPYLALAFVLYETWVRLNKSSDILTYGSSGQMYDWTLGGTCSSPPLEGAYGPDVVEWSSSADPANSVFHSWANACFSGQAFGGDPSWSGATVPWWAEVIIKLRPYNPWRAQIIQSYWRPGPASQPTFTPMPGQVLPYVVPAPYPWPQLDPFHVPPLVPLQVPRPLPWEAIPYIPDYNPRFNPEEQPRRSRPSRRKLPARPIEFIPFPDGKTVINIPILPGQPSVDIRPDAPPTIGPIFRPPQRPGRRHKEKKVTMRSVISHGLIKGVNIITEANDFITAVWYALPRRYQTRDYRGYTTPQGMVLDIYRHYDKVDLPKALKNVIYNELQDRFFGKIGRINAKASSRQSGERPVGFQTGPLF